MTESFQVPGDKLRAVRAVLTVELEDGTRGTVGVLREGWGFSESMDDPRTVRVVNDPYVIDAETGNPAYQWVVMAAAHDDANRARFRAWARRIGDSIVKALNP